jgi:hypothetical protein
MELTSIKDYRIILLSKAPVIYMDVCRSREARLGFYQCLIIGPNIDVQFDAPAELEAFDGLKELYRSLKTFDFHLIQKEKVKQFEKLVNETRINKNRY